MTNKTTIEDQAEIHILDDAELENVSGASIADVVVDLGREIWSAMITSPRDPASGLPTGKRSH
jgi:hypothetical protein